MRQVTVTFWLDEAVYTLGALKAHLKKTEEFLEKTKRDHPGCEGVVEMAIDNYKRAIATIEEEINS